MGSVTKVSGLISTLLLSALFLMPVHASFLGFGKVSLTESSRVVFAPSTDKPEIAAIDTVDQSLIEVIQLPHVAGSIVASDKTNLLLASDLEQNKVSVVDLELGQVIRQIETGFSPDAMLLNPFDRYVAFGSRDGQVAIWDLETFEPMFSVDGLDSAINLTFGNDGTNLFVVEPRLMRISVIEMFEKGKVAEIDLKGNAGVSARISAISRSADGFTGYASVTHENRVVVLDLTDFKVIKSIPVSRDPRRPYSTADNRYILIPHGKDQSVTVLGALNHLKLASIATHITAAQINTGWLDSVAFVMPEEGGEIAVIDLLKLKLEPPITMPGPMDLGVVTSDGSMLLTALSNSGDIAAIDTRTRKTKSLIPTPLNTAYGLDIAISNNVCH